MVKRSKTIHRILHLILILGVFINSFYSKITKPTKLHEKNYQGEVEDWNLERKENLKIDMTNWVYARIKGY